MGKFGIHGVNLDGAMTVVIGRCFQGPLRLGDVFRTVEIGEGVTAEAQLRIDEIEAYGHELNELHEGLTARLTLMGTGGQAVVNGCTLSTTYSVTALRSAAKSS